MEILFEDIFITKGYNRSLIVDLTKDKHYLISNNWYSKLISLNRKQCFSKLEDKELYNFLKKNELIANIDDFLLKSFTRINPLYETPNHFDSFLIHISRENVNDVITFLEIKENICATKVFKFFFDEDINIKTKENIFNSIYKFQIESSIILFCDKVDILISKYYPRILQSELRYKKSTNLVTRLSKEDAIFPVFIGNINQILNSSQFNTFIHKVLSINKNGNIDWLSKKTTINDLLINEIDFSKILNDSYYKTLSRIPMKEIEICKDCEFNRICIDSKTPIKLGNKWRKKDCNYNPYLSKWKDDDYYITSSKIGYFDEKGKFNISNS